MLLLMPLDFTCGLSFSVNYANYNMETRDQIYLNYLTHYTTRWGILYLTGTCYVSPPPGETYWFTLVCRQSASASASASAASAASAASVSLCGQDSRKTIRPRMIKLTHIGHWGMASTWLTFGGRDLIFKVTRGQCLWNLSLWTRFQKDY